MSPQLPSSVQLLLSSSACSACTAYASWQHPLTHGETHSDARVRTPIGVNIPLHLHCMSSHDSEPQTLLHRGLFFSSDNSSALN